MDQLDIMWKIESNLAEPGKLKSKPAMGKALKQAHSKRIHSCSPQSGGLFLYESGSISSNDSFF